MTPTQKKALSTLAASVAGFAVVAIGHAVAPFLPVAYQALIVSGAVALGHAIDAWGTDDKIKDKATDLTVAALDLANKE